MAPEILIYDPISPESLKPCLAAIAAVGTATEVTLRINSPGGNTATAMGMWAAFDGLKARNGVRITCIIDGIAASAASYLAMVGDKLVMPENALMMIHNPTGEVIGTANDARKAADALDRVRDMMAASYARKSGKSIERVRELMRAETWFTATEAVEAGFADEVSQPIKMAASALKNLPSKVPTNIAEFATNYWATRNRGKRPPPISATGVWDRWTGTDLSSRS